MILVLSHGRVPERQGSQRSELSSLNNAISFLQVCFRHHQQHRPVQPPCRFSAILEAPSPPLLAHQAEGCLVQQQAHQAVLHQACLAIWAEVLRMRNPVRHKHRALEADFSVAWAEQSRQQLRHPHCSLALGRPHSRKRKRNRAASADSSINRHRKRQRPTTRSKRAAWANPPSSVLPPHRSSPNSNSSNRARRCRKQTLVPVAQPT